MVIVTADALAPAECLGGRICDTRCPLEALMAVDNPQVPIEWTAGMIGLDPIADTTILIEALHAPTITNDSDLPIENTGATANATVGHSYQMFEWLSGIAVDPRAPLEIAGSASAEIAGDSGLTLEFLAFTPVGYIQIEWLWRVIGDSGAVAELAATLRRDSQLSVEALAAERSGRRAPVESAATSAGGSIAADALAPIGWLGAARADVVVILEIMAGSRSDLLMPAEGPARAARDLAARIENQSTGAVGRSSDSAMPLELTARLVGDTASPLAWVLSASVSADTAVAIELGHAKPSPPPPIDQISGDRIRLLRGD